MGTVTTLRDGLRNIVANLGTSRDKAAQNEYYLTTLSQEQLRNSYRGAWLPKKIIDIPAKDATRRWRNWSADGKQISMIEAEEKRLGLQRKVRAAQKAARLYGGSAILIGTGDNDLLEPLNLERVKRGGLRYVTVLSRYDLVPGEIDYSLASDSFGMPKDYSISTNNGETFTIHPSRLAIFEGEPLPDSGAARLDPWGDSILQSVLDAVKQADGTTANIASLVFEAKVDTIGIPGLTKLMADPGHEALVMERLRLAETVKGINGSLVHDKDEIIGQKRASFSQLPDVMDRFFQNVSGASDIPLTRLFGMSPAGLNSTGEGDLRNYYDGIQSMQELDIGPAMSLLDEALIRSALGSRPKEVFYSWRPLWQISEKDKSEIADKTVGAFEKVHRMGVIPDEAMGNAVVNALTEMGVAPGLEADVTEFFEGREDEDEDDISISDAAPRTLYVHRAVQNAADLIAWAKKQGFKATLPADDMHVTIAFSRKPVDWMKMGEAWQTKVEVPEGGARIMEQFGEARVLLFNSSSLSWRHEEMKREGATWDHPEYQPHITISYDDNSPDLSAIEPYTGEIILGPEVFAEIKGDWMSQIKED